MALDSRVYVIDDDDAARDALAFLLTVSKFSVAFDSAVAFLDSVAGLQAGCIVTDVRMPHDALVSGKPNKTIALELAMSPRTVEIHRAGIMTKMQARGLSHLVRMTFVAGS
jgi:FixJ family two-component response regulator